MVRALIWLTICMCGYFLATYATDEPDFSELEKFKKASPRKAEILDLPRTATQYDIKEYMEEHIIPSRFYYSMRHEMDARAGHYDELILYGMLLFPAALSLKCMFVYFNDNDGLVYALAACAIEIALAVLIGLLWHFVYNKKLKIPPMWIDKDYFERRVSLTKNDFDVSERVQKDNLITISACAYCYRVIDTVRKRMALRSMLTAVYGVVYLLFIFRSPYE